MVVISYSNDPNRQHRVFITFHHIAQTGTIDSRTQWWEHPSQRTLSDSMCSVRLGSPHRTLTCE